MSTTGAEFEVSSGIELVLADTSFVCSVTALSVEVGFSSADSFGGSSEGVVAGLSSFVSLLLLTGLSVRLSFVSSDASLDSSFFDSLVLASVLFSTELLLTAFLGGRPRRLGAPPLEDSFTIKTVENCYSPTISYLCGCLRSGCFLGRRHCSWCRCSSGLRSRPSSIAVLLF